MTVTRRPSLLKTEQEYKSTILTRSSDRAVSLPVERKNYVQDYPPGEKERGYSVQRDQVRFDNICIIITHLIYIITKYYILIIILFNRTIMYLYKLFQDLKHEGEDWETVVQREKEINRVDKPQEWGGIIGTLVLVFIFPMSIILPQLLCSKGQCKFAFLKLPVNLESYLNSHTLLYYIVFLTSLACISIIPIGKTIYGQQSKIGRLQYRINGTYLCNF